MRVQLAWLALGVAASQFLGCAKDRDQGDDRPDMQRGMQVYRLYCQECHDTGKGDAPELDDTDEWDERSFVWKSVLNEHASKGFLAMPAKGANPYLSERDLKDALYYMNIKIRSEED